MKGRRVNLDALQRSLMRACFKAEVLAGKCARLHIDDAGLDQAARAFRVAADRVEAMIERKIVTTTRRAKDKEK